MLNPKLTGKVYQPFSYAVTAEAIRSYARATNEDNPIFNSERPLAPPAFAFVAAAPLFDVVFGDPDLGVDMALLVHAEQEHRFEVPIVAGDRLEVSARLERVDLAGSGHSFTVAIALTNRAGELAADLRSTMLIRKTGTGEKAKVVDGEKGDATCTGTSVVDEDQPLRYARASGDFNPIHLDPDFARKSGFPGVVCHGMCTMAMASKVVLDCVAGSDPCRLKRLRVRFARPVFPGQTLTTNIWSLSGDGQGTGALQSYGFETVNARGAVVISNGLAEVVGEQR